MPDACVKSALSGVTADANAVEAVRRINKMVDDLIRSLLIADVTSGVQNDAQTHDSREVDRELFINLTKWQLPKEDLRRLVAEFVLRSLIFAILHSSFFEGRFFLGVDSVSLRDDLDRLLAELIAGGKSLLLCLVCGLKHHCFLFYLFIYLFIYFPRPAGEYDKFQLQRWRKMALGAVSEPDGVALT